MTVRVTEVVPFILRVQPEIVLVDVENVSTVLWKKLKNLEEIQLI